MCSHMIFENAHQQAMRIKREAEPIEGDKLQEFAQLSVYVPKVFRRCDAKFTELTNYLNHSRTHTGERPFKCKWQQCLKRFKTRGQLKDHEVRHTDNKPWGCKCCQINFYRKFDLLVHQKTKKHSSRLFRLRMKELQRFKNISDDKKDEESTWEHKIRQIDLQNRTHDPRNHNLTLTTTKND